MAELERFHRFGFMKNILAPEKDITSHLYRGMGAQNQLKKLVEETTRKMKLLDADSNYTEAGKKEFFRKIVEEVQKELTEIRRTYYDPIMKRLEELQAEAKKLRIKINPEEHPSMVLRETEIRQLLQSMDVSQRVEIFQQAIKDKDELTVRAFCNAPKFLNLLNQKTLDEGVNTWAKGQNPALVDELESVREVTEILAHDIGEVTAGLNEMAGIEKDMRERTREQLQNQA